jgi:hypothetical protein
MDLYNDNVVIHVGLHRTATTFLQNEIFPKLQGVNYKVYHDQADYNIIKDKINLISCESLSGSPTTWIKYNFTIRDILAKGLKAEFPDAKIIVGFRDKEKWAKSIYSHAVKQGRVYSSYESWYKKFDKKHLDFKGYLQLLNSLFENVYVYHLEDLQKDPDSFVRNMCAFIGVDAPSFENKKSNRGWVGWKLYLGRLRAYLIRKVRF